MKKFAMVGEVSMFALVDMASLATPHLLKYSLSTFFICALLLLARQNIYSQFEYLSIMARYDWLT